MYGGSWLLEVFLLVESRGVTLDLPCLVGRRVIPWGAGRDVTPTLHIVHCSGVMSGIMKELRR